MIAVYLVAIYLGQIGYCVLLVLARKRETKVCTLVQYLAHGFVSELSVRMRL